MLPPGTTAADDDFGYTGNMSEFGNLLFRIEYFIGAVPEQEFCLYFTVGTGNDEFSTEFFQKGSRFQRTLKVASDRHDADIIVVDAERPEKEFVGAVPNLRIRYKRQDAIDAIFIFVDGHDLMSKFMQLFGNIKT